MSAPRKRTNAQILSSLACNLTEAAQVLGVGWSTVSELVDQKRLRAFSAGKRTRIVVRSLSDYIEGEARRDVQRRQADERAS